MNMHGAKFAKLDPTEDCEDLINKIVVVVCKIRLRWYEFFALLCYQSSETYNLLV